MKQIGPGERLTVFVREADRHGQVPTYVEIVGRARRAGLAGATVLKGGAGFGAASRSHHVPVVVIIVDTEERITAFLPALDDLLVGGLLLRQAVEVTTYRTGTDRPRHR